MPTTNTISDTANCNSVSLETTEYSNSTDGELKSHFQQGGRYFLKDPATENMVNMSRLTAYAEYGREVYERDIHHEIPLLKIDAPKFLDPLIRGEHTKFHQEKPDPIEVDGIPLLRTGL